jgi:hypothetical protein
MRYFSPFILSIGTFVDGSAPSADKGLPVADFAPARSQAKPHSGPIAAAFFVGIRL